jgi:hypothetical protein
MKDSVTTPQYRAREAVRDILLAVTEFKKACSVDEIVAFRLVPALSELKCPKNLLRL